jgi:gluconolactonase
LRQVLTQVRERTLAEEQPLVYELHQGVDDPSLFGLYEVWPSREALDRHTRTEYFTGFFRDAGRWLAEPFVGARYVVLDRPTQPLLPARAQLEQIAHGLVFTEGPLWRPDETLLFTDLEGNKLLRLEADQRVTVLKAPALFANGTALDLQGQLLLAEHESRAVVRVLPDGQRQVLADRYEGKRLNSPNDLVVAPVSGDIYFTDPPFGLMKPWGPADLPQELPHQGLYRIDGRSGKLTLLSTALKWPNGLALSPDGRLLYVGDAATSRIHAFAVQPDGRLGEPKLFADLRVPEPGAAVEPFSGDRNPVDGMKVDGDGNLWTTGPGGVIVLSPQGQVLERIAVPVQTTNLGWGGPRGTDLYITAKGGLYRIETQARPTQPQR